MNLNCLSYVNIENSLKELGIRKELTTKEFKEIYNCFNNFKELRTILIDSFLIEKKNSNFKLGINGKNFLDKMINKNNKNRKFILFSLLSSHNFKKRLYNDLEKEFNIQEYHFLLDYGLYRKPSGKTIKTKLGINLILLMIAENEYEKYGRKKFLQKTSLSFEKLNTLSDFVSANKILIDLSFHTEAFTIKAVIDNYILKGSKELLYHDDVVSLRKYIFENYKVESKGSIALLLPCSKTKPYSLSPTTKSILKVVNEIQKSYKIKNKIEIFIVSEPIGIVPLEMQLKYPAASYDMILPGWLPLNVANKIERGNGEKIFESLNNNHETKKNSSVDQQEIIDFLSIEIGKFLQKNSKRFHKIFAYVRSTHRKMIVKTENKYNLGIEIIPTKKQISKIREKKGQIYWTFQGLRSPLALKILKNKLKLET